MRHYCLYIIRTDNGVFETVCIQKGLNILSMNQSHCSWIKWGNLIIFFIGKNKPGCGVEIINMSKIFIIDIFMLVFCEIFSNCCPKHCLIFSSKLSDSISNIVSGSSVILFKCRNTESHTELGEFIGQNVIGKVALIGHNIIISNGSRNENHTS